jgi:hypothetical protein
VIGDLLAGLLLIGVTALAFAVSHEWRGRFRRAAAEAGLRPRGWENRAEGEVGGYRVEVRIEGDDRGWSTVICVDGLPRTLSIAPAPRRGELSMPAERVSVGAPAFDRAWEVCGDERLARAALDAGARTFLQRFVDERGTARLSGGLLEARVPGYLADGFALGALVQEVVGLASGLFGAPEPAARLERSAFEDPEPGVRRCCLAALLAGPDGPRRRRAAQRALTHPLPELRLEAARAAGTSGWPALVGIALDESLPAALRAPAVDALPAGAPPRLLDEVGRVGLSTAGLGAAAAGLLGRLGPGGERAGLLLAALERVRGVEDRLAVIAALGRVGGAGAVAPLRALGAGKGLAGRLGPGRERAAAQRAVAAIQGRLVDAGSGALSLAAGEGGEVSLADEGALSLSGEREAP